jgi:hypothetical protein
MEGQVQGSQERSEQLKDPPRRNEDQPRSLEKTSSWASRRGEHNGKKA